MITINHLSLSLPGEFRYRAEPLARLIAHELTRMKIQKSFNIQHLDISPITVNPKLTDLHIAQQVAAQIHANVVQRGQRHVECT